jgi:hypothetical protein
MYFPSGLQAIDENPSDSGFLSSWDVTGGEIGHPDLPGWPPARRDDP